MLVRAGRPIVVVLALIAGLLGVAVMQTGTAAASTTVQDRVVSPTPVAWTPRVNDGEVDTIAQVGNTMVIGGQFTSVSNSSGGNTVTRKYIAAFDATTGALVSGFAPDLNGVVNKVLPGPVAGTVLVGGAFSTVNGVARRNVALLNVSTGAVVSSFATATMNGLVNSMAVSGNRLYIGGTFTTVGGKTHSRIASLNLTTGALDPFVNNQLSVNHNWYDGCSGCAQAAVSVKYLDVSADGSTLIATGNFKVADGYDRDQIVNIDLTGSSATVRPDWKSNAYTARCYDWAFDTYMRGLAMAPDGSYFVVVTTGGANAGAHCDAAARFNIGDRGQDVQPVWTDFAGGDTYTTVEVSGTAIYTGGHMRWVNNDYGSDSAGSGAVPRAGLVALDPQNGLPLSWNPGRNPRGYGVTAMLATSAGLWLGSDTTYIGNRQYLRPRLAFFPLTGGSTLPANQPMSLPANVYLGGAIGGATNSNILYRFNTGGELIGAIDNGPDWLGDSDAAAYRTGDANSAGWGGGVPVTSAVPSTTPNAIFDSESWGPSTGSGEMAYHLPVPAGQQVTVRLYLANRCSCTANAGNRVFNVSIDGNSVLNNYDIVADVGDQTGTMKSYSITSDGTVDIAFGHVTENPLIDGIEIVKDGAAPPPVQAGTLSRRWFDGSASSTADTAVASSIDWSTVRGAVQVDGNLFYGGTDGKLHKVSYNGQNFGSSQVLDPYHDPLWCPVRTGSGDTVFCGVDPNLAMSSVTAMAYSSGRLYYTLLGQTGLYYRYFTPESGVIGALQFQATGTLPAGSPALLISGGSLYFADRSTGNLSKVAFSPAGISGTPTLVSGPGIDGRDWRARAVFMAPGPNGPQPPKPPVASFTGSCTDMTCSFDGSASSDPDGTITNYLWDFGDGTTQPGGSTAAHTYTNPGQYTVKLTVTDNSGLTGSAQQTVNPSTAPPAAPVASFTQTCDQLDCSFDGSGSSTGATGALTYAWTFGDGSTGTGVNPSHTFGSAGTYPVKLTVTDSLSRSASITKQVTVSTANPVTPIAFVSAAASNAQKSTAQVKIPAETQAGDGLLALLSLGTNPSTTVAAPAGWTLEATGTNNGFVSRVYRHTATASDAGSTATFTFNGLTKASLDVAVYRGVATGDFVTATGASYGAGTARQAPAANVTTDGSWVLSWWTDKSNGTTTGWTLPNGLVKRSGSFGSGGGAVSSVVADANGAVPTGNYAARSATSNASGNKADAWTIVLTPAGSTPPTPAAPVARFTSNCTQLSCSFDATTSTTGAPGALTYAWNFGDNSTGSGANTTHTYAAGTYTVTLTVKDSLNRTDDVSHDVTVSQAPPVGNVTFVAGNTANGTLNAGKVTIPSQVTAGDGLVLLLSVASTERAPATPAGWTKVGDETGTKGMTTLVYTRTATASDAGSTVSAAYTGGYSKTAVTVLAYRGVATGAFLTAKSTAYSASSATREAPAAPVATDGSWVLSWWTDKSAATTTGWTLPGGLTKRTESYGTGAGAVSSITADAGPVNAGTYPARTATSTAPSGNAVAWTLVIAPA